MRMESRPVFGNCIQQTLYAMSRGFGEKLIVLKSRSIVWPLHLCLKLGNKFYAFETTKKYEAYAPWWFEGHWRKLDPGKVMQRYRFELPYYLGIPFNLGLIAAVIAPWCIAWMLYQPLFMLYWIVKGLKARKKCIKKPLSNA